MNVEERLDIVLKLITFVGVCFKATTSLVRWLKSNIPYNTWMQFTSFALRNWGILTAMLLWAVTVLAIRFHPYNIDWLALIILGALIVPSHERGISILKRSSQAWKLDLLFHVLRVFIWYIFFFVGGCIGIYLLFPSVKNTEAISTLPEHLSKVLIPMIEWAVLTGAVLLLTWLTMHNNIDNLMLKFRKNRLHLS